MVPEVITLLEPVKLSGGFMALVVGQIDVESLPLGKEFWVTYKSDMGERTIKGHMLEDFDYHPLKDVPQELLDQFGLYSHQGARHALMNYYKTGMGMDIPVCIYTISTDTMEDDIEAMEEFFDAVADMDMVEEEEFYDSPQLDLPNEPYDPTKEDSRPKDWEK